MAYIRDWHGQFIVPIPEVRVYSLIFTKTRLKGAFVIEPERFEDERGFFARTWCQKEFEVHKLHTGLVQCSVSFNKRKATLRGMHYQVSPCEETKLVRCTMGSIYDVIIDLRPMSLTFKQHISVNLTAENRKTLYVPEGFAHGFQTFEDNSEVFYQISAYYAPEYARGVRWNDPDLASSGHTSSQSSLKGIAIMPTSQAEGEARTLKIEDLKMNLRMDEVGLEMYRFISELYPICRSITGNGLRETLRLIRNHIPLSIHEVSSGTSVFDWTVPKEWNIRDAYLMDAKGEKIIDFAKSNLHVVNYSVPVRKKVSFKELKEHLFTLPSKPDWIPYRTSYYKENWGFCLSHKQLLELDEEEYEVCIDSSLAEGHLSYGEYYLEGSQPG